MPFLDDHLRLRGLGALDTFIEAVFRLDCSSTRNVAVRRRNFRLLRIIQLTFGRMLDFPVSVILVLVLFT